MTTVLSILHTCSTFLLCCSICRTNVWTSHSSFAYPYDCMSCFPNLQQFPFQILFTFLQYLAYFLHISLSFFQLNFLFLILLCCLPDPFRGMGAWWKTMEPQKASNSPGSGPEYIALSLAILLICIDFAGRKLN